MACVVYCPQKSIQAANNSTRLILYMHKSDTTALGLSLLLTTM